jgi:hypothetical protein
MPTTVDEIRKSNKTGEPLGAIYPKLELSAKKGLFLLGTFKGTSQGVNKDEESFNNHNFTVIETNAKARIGKDKNNFAVIETNAKARIGKDKNNLVSPKAGEFVTLRGKKFDRIFLATTPAGGKYLIEYLGGVDTGKAQPMHDYSVEPIIE